MVDASLVLDAIVAVSIAAGALFAVFELRDLKKDRRVQLMLEATMHYATRDFEDALCKLWRADTSDPKELEKQVSYADLCMVADFHWAMARLGQEGLVDRKVLIRLFAFSGVWNRIKPWIAAERAAAGLPEWYSSLEKLAELQEREYPYFST